MKICISDCDHANINQETEVFQKNNVEFVLKQCKTEDDLIEQCQDYEVFLNQYVPFTRKVFENMPNIKHVVRYGVGVNSVDVEAATEYGVQISNVPDYGMNEVADQAVALMMGLVRKTHLINNYTKTQKWDYTKAIPIYRIPGKTVGVFGIGRIGKTFAKRMSGFDVNLIAVDPIYKIGEIVNGATIVDFDTLLKTSDVISIHCPLDASTKYIFDIEALKKMKSSAYLINVSRGGIINEDDLLFALENGVIAGAAIDVVENESMSPGAKLFELDNFLITPHIAWYSEEAALELKTKIAQEACRFVKGEAVLYPINNLN
ncbi:MAG: C-terminal binding protein [Clostridia bacterium]